MDNYNALKEFFRLMPTYRSNPFYISGESYAGIYVPTLSVRVIQGLETYPLNFKGVAIGNGMLSYTLNTDTLVLFAYYHGLVSETEYLANERECCQGCGDTCDYTHTSGTCDAFVHQVMSLLDTVNMYDLYGNCYVPAKISNSSRYFHDAKLILGAKTKEIFDREKQKHRHRHLGLASVGEHVPCINDTAITNYLNQKSVRKSLFIPASVPQWAICNQDVGSNYKTLYNDMFSQIRVILDRKIPILVYNGDTDMACNFLMGQKFCQLLGLKELEPKKFWMNGGQVGGSVTRYEGLQFVTVRGAGHMVPQWRPQPALNMISKFLAGVPL